MAFSLLYYRFILVQVKPRPLCYTRCEVFKIMTRDRRRTLLIAKKTSFKFQGATSLQLISPRNNRFLSVTSSFCQELAYVPRYSVKVPSQANFFWNALNLLDSSKGVGAICLLKSHMDRTLSATRKLSSSKISRVEVQDSRHNAQFHFFSGNGL